MLSSSDVLSARQPSLAIVCCDDASTASATPSNLVPVLCCASALPTRAGDRTRGLISRPTVLPR